MATDALRVDGLAEFRRELKAAGAEMPRALQKVNKAQATKVVYGARRLYESSGYRPRTKRTQRRGLRALASQTRAQVALGAATVPWAAGQEFGSRGRFPQFMRGVSRGGRGARGNFFYPAIRAARPRLEDEYLDALDALSRRAFPGRT